MEKIKFENFEDCVRLTNGEVEVVVSTAFGPRILAYNFVGGENVLGLHPESEVPTALGVFKPYGGHRFWLAPEIMPQTYAPDNSPVEFETGEKTNSIRLIQPVEDVSKTQKEITITLDESGTGVEVKHKVTNCGENEIELAAWALTIMRGGGEVSIPNEPFAEYGAETLLPVRNLTLWSYSDLTDPRWKLDKDFIRLKVDETKTDAQKIGVLNKQGWAKYELSDVVFTKKFEHKTGEIYPDMNSNMELYTAGNFIEIETLAPLRKLEKGDSTEHFEKWSLDKK